MKHARRLAEVAAEIAEASGGGVGSDREAVGDMKHIGI